MLTGLMTIVQVLTGCGATPESAGPGNESSSSSSSSSSASSSSSSTSSSTSSASSSSGGIEAPLVYAVNLGGPAIAAGSLAYGADRFASGGTPHSVSDPIGGTSAEVLYQSERYGSYSVDIPLTDAIYDVRLSFAELYHGAADARLFSLSVEGQAVLSDFDLFSEAGQFEAYDIELRGIRVSDGFLTVQLESLVDNATLAGIAVFSDAGQLQEPPLPEPLPVTGENPGADCSIAPLPAAASLPSLDGLPDPFLALDGSRLTDKSQWRCRRQEILQQAYTYIYGEKPPKPERVTGTVSSSTIAVTVEHEGRSIAFDVSVSLPSGAGPFPAMIGYGGGFFGTGIPAEMQSVLNANGIATIQYDPYTLGAENGGPNAAGEGLFYDLYGSGHPAGLLTAWGYGVSRIIDVLELNPELIDPTHIGVTGCSRFGKGPFIASAFDARIALAIPVESGIGGVPSLKMVPVTDPSGEQPSHALNYQKWLSPSAFSYFTNRLAQLPVDTHETIGLIAPRGLLIIDNPPLGGNANLDANAAYGAALAGREIYSALGYGDNLGYVGAAGGHCQWRAEYTAPMTAAVRRFLKDDASARLGTITTAGTRTDMSPWITWPTPTLSGSLD